MAGGRGSRLGPLTTATNKQLLPIYDKPMIFYPLTTLILAGVTELYVVTNPEHEGQFMSLLGSGGSLGIKISYLVQDSPRGLSDALKLIPKRNRNENYWVALGDNFFFGKGLGRELRDASNVAGCTVFSYQVANPSDYGVAEIGDNGQVKQVVEKPEHPSSKMAITGLYRFDAKSHELIESLSPSERGELEITSLLNCYAREGGLQMRELPRGTIWMDLGSVDMILEASGFVRTVQSRTGQAIGDPFEASKKIRGR